MLENEQFVSEVKTKEGNIEEKVSDSDHSIARSFLRWMLFVGKNCKDVSGNWRRNIPGS